MQTKGRLYLIPVTLGETSPETVIPGGSLEILHRLNEFVAEDIHSARRHLHRARYSGDLNTVTFHLYNEHSQPADIVPVINALSSGHDIGLLSEAGLPCVADPGSAIVQEAHRKGLQVIPLTGPSSVMLALMASGFNGQNFTFHGYLPVRSQERIRQIRLLEKMILRNDQTQIFMEAPYRNLQLFEDILRTCSDEIYLCVACDLTLDTEWIRSQPVREWKKDHPAIHKRPAVFLLYK
ncbi:MAG TPA: SAM-dependent methyltransferase [Bacteroidales bacterium]|nr:SAM-dependent methyltransferase [Bacteroidales bacterium]HNS45940.1 SAM-dependent methyltransferase [Bacteroidales bacterium]